MHGFTAVVNYTMQNDNNNNTHVVYYRTASRINISNKFPLLSSMENDATFQEK